MTNPRGASGSASTRARCSPNYDKRCEQTRAQVRDSTRDERRSAGSSIGQLRQLIVRRDLSAELWEVALPRASELDACGVDAVAFVLLSCIDSGNVRRETLFRRLPIGVAE